MSFVREALAVTVLEALCPKAAVAGTGDFPTKAGKFVFLEKVEPLDDLATDHPAPVIIIYTGSDEGVPMGQHGPPFRRTIEVELALAVLARSPPDEGDPEPFLAPPETDRALFSALNALEAQVRGALLSGPSGRHFRALKQKIGSLKSEPVRYGEEGLRFAERRILLSVQVPDDCLPGTGEGIARLPQPLRKVAEDLMTTGYAAEIASALASAAPAPPETVPFTGVTLDIDVTRPADGAADIVADVLLEQP